jgi:hypothetical protein
MEKNLIFQIQKKLSKKVKNSIIFTMDYGYTTIITVKNKFPLDGHQDRQLLQIFITDGVYNIHVYKEHYERITNVSYPNVPKVVATVLNEHEGINFNNIGGGYLFKLLDNFAELV